jgi:hypothetical protein
MSRYSLDQLFPLAPDPVAGCMRSGLDGSCLGSAVESPPGADSQDYYRLTHWSEKIFREANASTCHF